MVVVKEAKARPLTRWWMYWRHCCCKYGIYPVLVAPLVTAACLLSLYSSAGCEFIHVTVGFTPSNLAYNESELLLGFWHYHDADFQHDNAILDTFHEGCHWYKDIFEQAFIESDRTWKVGRIMAMISGLSSSFATFLAWLFCLTPLPAGFFWPGLLLPVVMVAFIAEGSKFLLFDVGICRSSVWLPSGVNSLPQPASSCSLGFSAILSIASGAVLLVCLLMVCLKVPNERELDPHFGTPAVRSGGSGGAGGSQETSEYRQDRDMDDEEAMAEESIYTQDVYTTTAVEEEDEGRHAHEEEEEVVNEDDANEMDQESEEHIDEVIEESVMATEYGSKSDTATDQGRVSASRLSKMAAMEERAAVETSESLIDKLVKDLNCTYQS